MRSFPKGRVKKKKMWNFPDLVWPTHPYNCRKSGKNKIFIVLKWFLGNFEQFWKNLFFHLRKCHTLERDVDHMFLVILLCGWHNARWGRQNARPGWHNVWCGRHNACEMWWVGQTQSVTPPIWQKISFF